MAAGVYSGWSHGIAVREQIMLVPYSLILIQLMFSIHGVMLLTSRVRLS